MILSKKKRMELISEIQYLIFKGSDPEKENTVFCEEWIDLDVIADFVIKKINEEKIK